MSHTTNDLMKKCPNCNFAENNDGAKFCSNCGAPLTDTGLLTKEFVDFSRLMRNNMLESVVENGCVITPCSWDYAGDFHEGLAWVQQDEQRGYIDMTGNMVIPNKWKFADNFSEGLAKVTNRDQELYIDRKGDIVITCQSGYCLGDDDGFHEGLAIIRDENNRKYGFIDKRGNIVIPCKWNSATSFVDGLASVSNENGKYGCVDKSGRLVIPCDYDEEIIFSESLGLTFSEEHTLYKQIWSKGCGNGDL